MATPAQKSAPESEEQLIALLATLKVEPSEEADFESRFLCEFHERVAREAVCCPARRHLLSHLMQLVDNLGRGRLAFGASALGLGVLAVCFASYPSSQLSVETAASVAPERKIAPLVLPVLSNDLEACTSIRVESARASSEMGGITVTHGQYATVIEIPNTTVISVPHRQGSSPSLPAPSVRYAF